MTLVIPGWFVLVLVAIMIGAALWKAARAALRRYDPYDPL